MDLHQLASCPGCMHCRQKHSPKLQIQTEVWSHTTVPSSGRLIHYKRRLPEYSIPTHYHYKHGHNHKWGLSHRLFGIISSVLFHFTALLDLLTNLHPNSQNSVAWKCIWCMWVWKVDKEVRKVAEGFTAEKEFSFSDCWVLTTREAQILWWTLVNTLCVSLLSSAWWSGSLPRSAGGSILHHRC